MKVGVRYFASMRERVGRGRDEFELPPEVGTVGALRDWLLARGEPWSSAFADTHRLRVALNQEMAADATVLTAGDEIAFFPPVTGG